MSESPTTPTSISSPNVIKKGVAGPKSFTFDKLTKEIKSHTEVPAKSPRLPNSGAKPQPFKTTTLKKKALPKKKINLGGQDLSITVEKEEEDGSPSPKDRIDLGSPDMIILQDSPVESSPKTPLSEMKPPKPPLPESKPPPIIPSSEAPPIVPSSEAPEIDLDEEEEMEEEVFNFTPLGRKPSVKHTKYSSNKKKTSPEPEENDSQESNEEEAIFAEIEGYRAPRRSDSKSFIEETNVNLSALLSPLSSSYSPSSSKLRSLSSARLKVVRNSISVNQDSPDQTKLNTFRAKSHSITSSNAEKFSIQHCSYNWKVQLKSVQKEISTQPQLSHWRDALHKKRITSQ
jgi:hypothetical protein